MAVISSSKITRYYVTNKNSNTLSVIDGDSNNVIQTYEVGEGPKEVLATEDEVVYVASPDSDTVTIIYKEGDKRILNIPNEGYIAVDSVMGRLYTSKEGMLRVYDVKSGSLVISIDGLIKPGHMILNHGGNKLFIADDNIVRIYNTITLEYINTISVPERINYIAISKDDTRAFIAYGSIGNMAGVTIYDLVNNKTLTNITGSELTAPVAIAQKNNILYVVNKKEQGTVICIDATTFNILTKVIPVGDNPTSITLSPDNEKLYVVNSYSGNINIIDLLSNEVNSISLGEANQPVDIACSYAERAVAVDRDTPVIKEFDKPVESVSIMAKKVFSSCQQRICFPVVNISLEKDFGKAVLEKVTFENGSVVPGTLKITPLPDRPNYSRIQLVITVPFKAFVKSDIGKSAVIKGVLPNIEKDIVMYKPQTRDEFKFDTVIETRSEVLSTPSITEDSIKVAVGVFLVIKIIGEVELIIPAYKYNIEPPECEVYQEPKEEDICEIFLDFNQTPFPDDFFPSEM